MKTYMAELAVIQRGSQFEKTYRIHFVCVTRLLAALDAKRWFERRKIEDPTEFHMLGAVALYDFDPSPVDQLGYLLPATRQFFEWKYDFPGTYKEWAEVKLGVKSSSTTHTLDPDPFGNGRPPPSSFEQIDAARTNREPRDGV